jgi:hypothetical protein
MPDKKGTGKHPHKSSAQSHSKMQESSGPGGAGTARAMEKTEEMENKGQHGHSSGKNKK